MRRHICMVRAILVCLIWLAPLTAAHSLLEKVALASRNADMEQQQNATVLDPAKLPLCFGSSSNASLVQQTPFLWPLNGSPVDLFTHEPASVWEFRVIPQSDISVVKEGWQAIAPLVNQTGPGECCITRVIGVEPLLELDVVVQVHQHVNATHSYNQCALVRFVRAGPDPIPRACRTGDDVEASWTQELATTPGSSAAPSGKEDGPSLPVIPSGLESGTCPHVEDVDPADRAAARSYMVLGTATETPCLMLLHPMDKKDVEDEMARSVPSGAADRASRKLLGSWLLGLSALASFTWV